MTGNVIDRLNAALASRYRIERELGAGGMATVYLAVDLRHDREVAVKVLRPELAAVVGAGRFLEEIRTTARLQHPNILPLHDSGEADGFLFYVTPYVAGESLRHRLNRETQLPIAEAVRIASEVADALQAAHVQGVIHRDIKPANILLSSGRPLVADFGIALAVNAAGRERLTETGLSLGTPHYMSPEQATGTREPTGATDVYSLGCMLYEMLVGEPPYTGATASAVLAKILTDQPEPVSAHRPSVPSNVAAAVRRAIERIPADRFRSAATFRAALADPGFRYGPGDAPESLASSRPVWRSPVAWAMVVASFAAGGILSQWLRTDAPNAPVLRYQLALPEAQVVAAAPGRSIAVSRDGDRIVYVGRGEGGDQLWIRDRDQLRSRPVPGTTGARHPFFSPDGSAIGFTTINGALRVIALNADEPLTLVAAGVAPGGGAWSDDGFIYFGSLAPIGLVRVPATGGHAPESVYADEVGSEVLRHAWPDPLPGGNGVIVTVVRNHENDLVAALDTRTGEMRPLIEGTVGLYAESGHLVWVERDGSLFAAPFDARAMNTTGPAVLLEELGEGFAGDIAISDSGRLMYSMLPPPIFEVVLVDRDGTERPLDTDAPLRGIRFLALSPDGSHLAVNTWTAPPRDDGQVWIKRLPTGPFTRLTFEGDVNFRPAWHPDGQSVLFISDRGDNRDVWIQPADGSADARLLLDDAAVIDEAVLSADGEWLIYRRGMQDGERDIWAVRTDGDGPGMPLLETEFDETSPSISPDGRWLAWVSGAGGQPNVYLRPFPDGSPIWRVSTDGGIAPVWTRDGNELLFVSSADSMISVNVSADRSPPVGQEDALFSTWDYRTDFFHSSFDVTPDAQTFFMIRIDAHGPLTEQVIVVENFLAELNTRVGR